MREKDSIQENFNGATVRVSEVIAYLERDRMMNKAQLAEFLGWSERKITNILSQIPHFREGREVRFRKSEILQWFEQFRETGTAVDLDAIGEQIKARRKWAPKQKERR